MTRFAFEISIRHGHIPQTKVTDKYVPLLSFFRTARLQFFPRWCPSLTNFVSINEEIFALDNVTLVVCVKDIYEIQ